MPTMKNSGDLITSISTDLADNNAGLISAEDVRHNMEDLAYSINKIICSGNTDGGSDIGTQTGHGFPFYKNVRARQTSAGDASQGIFIAESGIAFPNWPITVAGITSNTQIQPFPGINNINHNDLANKDVGNPHTQYYHVDGTNPCTDDFKLGNNWINASGYERIGLKFVPVGPSGYGETVQGHDQEIYVSGNMRFSDQSVIPNTAKGVAQAWVQFDGNGGAGVPSVRSFHNVSGIYRSAEGKYEIHLASGIFRDDGGASFPHFIAIGHANATTASGSIEDGVVNTVLTTMRQRVDNNKDRHMCSVVVRSETGDYVDSELIDIVFYGLGKNVASGSPPVTASVSQDSF